jgi:hypothetical protein
MMAKDKKPNPEAIIDVEALGLYVLLVTFEDHYKCIFDFGELVPKYTLYNAFQANPNAFYQFEFGKFHIDWKNASFGTDWQDVSFASDNIREDAAPLDDIKQWVREQMRNRVDDANAVSREEIRQ